MKKKIEEVMAEASKGKKFSELFDFHHRVFAKIGKEKVVEIATIPNQSYTSRPTKEANAALIAHCLNEFPKLLGLAKQQHALLKHIGGCQDTTTLGNEVLRSASEVEVSE